MRTLLTAAAFTTLSLVLASAADARGVFVLDGSASMRGFVQAEGGLQCLVPIQRAAEAVGMKLDSRVMVSKGRNANNYPLLPTWLSHPEFGGYSPLDAVYKDQFPSADWFFLLTDNVQTGADDTGTESFYRQFKQPEVGHVYIVPMKLRFRGPLFFGRNGNDAATLARALGRATPGGKFGTVTDNGTNLVAPYEGERRVVLYALARAGADTGPFFGFLRTLREQITPDVLLIKPIDGKQFEVDGVDNIQDVVRARQSFPPPAHMQLPPLAAPSLHLKKVPGTSDMSGYLAPPDNLHLPNFQLQSTNQATFYFRLRSHLEHLVIGQPGNPWGSQVKLLLSPPQVQLGESGQLLPAGSAGEVSPPHLVGGLSAVEGVSLPQYIYQAKVRFGPFPDPWQWNSPSTWLQSLNPVPAHLRFDLNLQVPGESLALDRTIANRHFTSDVLAVDRIYAPTDIVRYLASGSLDVPLRIHMSEANIPQVPGGKPSVRWRFMLPPSQAPFYLLLASIATLLLATGASIARLWRPHRWSWQDGLISQLPGGLTIGRVSLHCNDEELALLHRGLWSSKVVPAAGFTWEDASTDPRAFKRGATLGIYQGSRHIETLNIE